MSWSPNIIDSNELSRYEDNSDRLFNLEEFITRQNKVLLKVDEFRKLQLIQNGKYSTFDPYKDIKIKVLVDNRMISYVEVKLGYKITYLMTLFDDNNILFTRNGYIINPSRTFGNFGFRNEEKIEVIHFIPGKQVPLKNEIEWTKIANLSEETRVRSIYQENLCTEMARINDIRTKKIKKHNITNFKRVGGKETNNRHKGREEKTVIPDAPEFMSTSPLPVLFEKTD